MKHPLTIAIALLVGSAAHAVGPQQPQPAPEANAGAVAGAAAGANSLSASQSQSSSSTFGVVGGSSAETGASVSSLEFSSEYKQKRQAPNVYAPPVVPTAPCIVATSGGLSIPGGGVSLGRGKTDKECELRETARMFNAFGETEFALQLLCSSDAVWDAKLSEFCPKRGREKEIVLIEDTQCENKLERCENVTRK